MLNTGHAYGIMSDTFTNLKLIIKSVVNGQLK